MVGLLGQNALQNFFQNGLLGLGGPTAALGTQLPDNSMQQFYNPEAMRRYQIKRGLLGAGVGMLAQEPTIAPQNLGTQIGRGLGVGLLAADNAGQDYTQNALLGSQLADQQSQREADMAQQQAEAAWIASLPPDQQALAKVNPNAIATQQAQAMYPDPARSNAALNLTYWTDANGKLHAGQTLQGGGIREVPVPGGGNWAPGVQQMDVGTGYQGVDRRTGQPIGPPLPKDIAGAASQEQQGQAAGKAIAAAPADIAAANDALDIITQIETSPNIDWGTGLSSYGNVVRGTPGYDFQNLVDQAKSGAFLTAIQTMRGLGSLSNAEGDTATKAVTRMNTATSKEAFLAALNDYKAVIQRGKATAEARLANANRSQPGAPQGGSNVIRYDAQGKRIQ